MQRGKIFRKGSSWHLRYKTYRIVDGKKVWQTTSTKLADIDLQHRTKQTVEENAEKFLKSINPIKRPGVLGKGIPTFEEQAKIWLDASKGRVKTKTLRNWRSHLSVHVLPKLGNHLLSDVTNKAVKD